MLPKKYRLNLRDYPEFFKHAKRVQTTFFRLFITPATNDSLAAVIVPKTASMTATKRTKLKRKLRAALCPILQTHPRLKIVVVGYEKALDKKVSKLEALIEEKI